ncbi:MAG TPA: ester cyclase [Chitinophagaceae bacterium]|nr:ester cyclase [Chitinophagaceae bacterium]
MKSKNILLLLSSLLMLVIVYSCNDIGQQDNSATLTNDSASVRTAAMPCDETTLQKNLAVFDRLDYEVFSGQKWTELHESHGENIVVYWPDGRTTTGLEPHIADLKMMFTYAPDTRIKQHPVKFGKSTGEWTCVTGFMEGTFTKPMVKDGKTIAPTGKAFKLPMCTVGHWSNGVMTEEYLYFDNKSYMEQMGIMN